jgi:hypothetical protein
LREKLVQRHEENIELERKSGINKKYKSVREEIESQTMGMSRPMSAAMPPSNFQSLPHQASGKDETLTFRKK